MNIILLSGGSGKRLWPMSNDIRSKQFVKIFKAEDGTYESMIQRMYRQITRAVPSARITIASSKSQVSAIFNQLREKVNISIEPCRRDTFPAIALACAWLRDEMGCADSEPVVVCPVDPYVDPEYFECIRTMGQLAASGSASLTLMGIAPTEPCEKFGYIIPEAQAPLSAVSSFKEKPDRKTAEAYLRQGALWNGGVFSFQLGYLLKQAHRLLDYKDYRDLYNRYDTLKKISFDYAVAEREPDIQVLRYSGQWRDLGTWNSLTEVMDEPCLGKATMNDRCRNVHIINEIGVPILAMGLENVVISASPEGILVSDKEQSTQIKPFVDSFRQQIMFAEKSWGSFRVLDVEDSSLTIKVTLNPGHQMNYHSHRLRNEIWTVTSGTGYAVVDGHKWEIYPGDVIKMPVGCKHTVIARSQLQLVEVQLGSEITVHDKQKHPRDWAE